MALSYVFMQFVEINYQVVECLVLAISFLWSTTNEEGTDNLYCISYVY